MSDNRRLDFAHIPPANRITCIRNCLSFTPYEILCPKSPVSRRRRENNQQRVEATEEDVFFGRLSKCNTRASWCITRETKWHCYSFDVVRFRTCVRRDDLTENVRIVTRGGVGWRKRAREGNGFSSNRERVNAKETGYRGKARDGNVTFLRFFFSPELGIERVAARRVKIKTTSRPRTSTRVNTDDTRTTHDVYRVIVFNAYDIRFRTCSHVVVRVLFEVHMIYWHFRRDRQIVHRLSNQRTFWKHFNCRSKEI